MKSSLRQTATPQHRSRPRGNDRPHPKTPSSGQHPRRRFLHLAAGAAALLAASPIARAQTYPTRPVRIIVGFPPGGASDIVARLIGQWLSERLGQQFIIENRPGAGNNIAVQAVINSPPDGHTLLLAQTASAINACQGQSGQAQHGVGSAGHLSGELFKMMTGVQMTHVPYRSAGPALTDLIGGQIQVLFAGALESIEHVRTGKLRPLAVTTATRSDVLPDVPTVGDFVTGYEASSWYGVSEIVERLNKEINAGLASPLMKARLADQGGAALPGSPADFGKLIADETEKWGKVVRAANIKPE